MHVRQDHGGTLHDAAANHDNLGVVHVDETDGIRRPNLQTALTNRQSDRIATFGLFKKLFKTDFPMLRQSALGEARPLCGDQRQRPAGSFGFRATNASASAPSAGEENWNMATQAARLHVPSAH